MRVGCGGCGVGGEVVQAGFCAVVVKVSSGWIRGAVERVRSLRERQEARLAGVVIPELADGTFSRARGFRDSTIDALAGSRPRASLDSRLWCLGGLMMESRALCADIRAHFVAKNSPHGRKMTPPDLPHLLHPVSPVHILSYS